MSDNFKPVGPTVADMQRQNDEKYGDEDSVTWGSMAKSASVEQLKRNQEKAAKNPVYATKMKLAGKNPFPEKKKDSAEYQGGKFGMYGGKKQPEGDASPFAKYDEGAGEVIRMAEKHIVKHGKFTKIQRENMHPSETYKHAVKLGWKPPKP